MKHMTELLFFRFGASDTTGEPIWRMIRAGVGPSSVVASMTFLAIRTGGWGWWVIAALFAVCGAAVRPVIAWIERTPRNGEPVPAGPGGDRLTA